jgi:hypothetical protein
MQDCRRGWSVWSSSVVMGTVRGAHDLRQPLGTARTARLEDGSEVVFESAESDLVQLHGGGDPDVVDGVALQARLAGVASPEQLAGSLRSRLTPEEIALEHRSHPVHLRHQQHRAPLWWAAP